MNLRERPEGLGRYTYAPMAARLFQRLSLILSLGGIFVSAVLAIAHVLGRNVPCGASRGCATVAAHPSSHLLFGLDNAYLGLAAYLVLAVLASMRLLSARVPRWNLTLSYIVCVAGVAFSGYLTYLEIEVIEALCVWCLASAVLITLLLVTTAAEFQITSGEESTTAPSGRRDFAFVLVASAVCLLGVVATPAMLREKFVPVKAPIPPGKFMQFPLVPTDANIFGDPNAPVTIVEFADLQCPSCRSEFPKIKELVSSYKGKVRWIFRHYPLTNEHPLALTGAAMAEFAATKGKFFDFVTAVYNADPESLKSADDLLKIAESVGLSPTEVRAQVTDESSVAFNRVSRDVQAASVYGLVWTPTFFIFSTGNETKPDVAVGDEVQEVLKLKKYQQAMGNAGQ